MNIKKIRHLTFWIFFSLTMLFGYLAMIDISEKWQGVVVLITIVSAFIVGTVTGFSGKKDKMIEQSIKNARERWEKCLEEVNGDIEKARGLYDKK